MSFLGVCVCVSCVCVLFLGGGEGVFFFGFFFFFDDAHAPVGGKSPISSSDDTHVEFQD